MPNSRTEWFANSSTDSAIVEKIDSKILDFHKKLDGYFKTPLVRSNKISEELGIANAIFKIENSRFGMPAFKGLGASWASRKAIEQFGASKEKILVTATDGNHGRALAHFARKFGYASKIFIPKGVSQVAIDAIKSEGSSIEVLPLNYDETVIQAAIYAKENNAILVQDTAWDGYTDIPNWIVDGYTTLLFEAQEQLNGLGITAPDLVVVPTGVGSFLQAVLKFYKSQYATTKVISVEPEEACCMIPSLINRTATTVETGTTIMAGLNCGTPSFAAWPLIERHLDGCLSIDDDSVRNELNIFRDEAIDGGPCGASGSAAVRSVLKSANSENFKKHLGLNSESTILFLVTEGASANGNM